MSKTKTMRIAVIAAIMSLMLALSAWVALLPAHAANTTDTGNVDTGNVIRLGSPDEWKAGQIRIRLSQFVQCGDVNDGGEMDKEGYFPGIKNYVKLFDPTQTEAGKSGEQTASHVRTESNSNMLQIYFANGDEYYKDHKNWGLGTTLTIKSGFTFGKDGKTCNVTEDIVYTKTAEAQPNKARRNSP